MFRISETDVKFKYPKEDNEGLDDDIKIEALWHKLDDNFSQALPFIEQTVERWNSRTMLQQNQKKKSAFNATII